MTPRIRIAIPLRCGVTARQAARGLLFTSLALAAMACSEPASPPTGHAAGAKGAKSTCEARPIRMAVASSLRGIALALTRDLASDVDPIEVEASFGASSALARQLALGAPIDLLVSADAEIVEELARRGLIDPGSQTEIARGRLVLVAHADSTLPSTSLAALSSPALERIALPASAVPLGRYARAWLESQGLLAELEGRIVTTEHARATLAAVDQGHVDLALVYESDARLAGRVRLLDRIDPTSHPPIRYVAARATRAPACADVARVLDGWGDARTRARLEQAGFVVDESVTRATRVADGIAAPPTAPESRP